MRNSTAIIYAPRRRDAYRFYVHAKNATISRGGASEIAWQSDRDFMTFTEQDLLRESAWVILCSGFRESIVRQKFSYISICFGDWGSAFDIVQSAKFCVTTAAYAISHTPKLLAIVSVAEHIHSIGFNTVKARILNNPLEYVLGFPYIGKVTSRHLLKNLGFAIAKPDRHLLRVARTFGYYSVDALCEGISMQSGDPVQIVDLVLWRYGVTAYATSHLQQRPMLSTN